MSEIIDINSKKLQSGDEEYYKSLFHAHYQSLCLYAYNFTEDLDMARDIAQEVFVKLYEKRFNISINTSLKSYLFRSIHNACLNYLKQNKIHASHHKAISDKAEKISDNPEELIIRSELGGKILAEVNSLPPQCSKIFKMNRFDGLKNQEIAERLNLSKRTVETQISKALRILRKKIKNKL